MLKLDLNKNENSNLGSRLKSVYERIAAGDDYQRNDRSLNLIMICVITLSAAMTGFVNAYAHIDRLGVYGAAALGLCITVFVEKFYFTVTHGLRTVYQSRKQRFIAHTCCRIIQLSMILNGMVVAALVTGFALPNYLQWWSRWSIAINFALALVGVSELRAADAVVEEHIRKLNAEAREEALQALQNPTPGRGIMIRTALRLKRWLDGYQGAKAILQNRSNIYIENRAKIYSETKTDVQPENNNLLPPLASQQYLLTSAPGTSENVAESTNEDEEDVEDVATLAPPQRSLEEESDIQTYRTNLKQRSTGRLKPRETTQSNKGTAQVIQLHAQSETLSVQHLRNILPEVTNGWWSLRDVDNYYFIKLGWRETDGRSQTLTFPRLAVDEFNSIYNSLNPHELMKTYILDQLRQIAEDPKKESKVQAVSDKLMLDLSDEEFRKQA